MLLAPYYREYELPWEGDEESNERFRKILRVLLIILALFGILFPLLPHPKHTIAEEVPERLARVMTQTPKPPPPPPPPKPKEEEKPKIEPKVAMVKPPPVDEHQRAHEKAQKQLNQVKDELADLRDVMDLTPLETKNLSGRGRRRQPRRALADHLQGRQRQRRHHLRQRQPRLRHRRGLTHRSRGDGGQLRHRRSGLNARGPAASGGGGKAARSREEIELVFDRNKGRIYSLYARALRDNAELQGKLVLEFTIAPNGEVTMCRVVSSELKDPDLERKIIALVRLFRFDPKDVDTITTTKPIDFFPA